MLYTLLAAGPALHCHGIEDVPGHRDHCQGCHWTHFSPLMGESTHIATPRGTKEILFYPPVSAFSHTFDAVLRNRAPPVV